jgi:hypothetical protein
MEMRKLGHHGPQLAESLGAADLVLSDENLTAIEKLSPPATGTLPSRSPH